MKIKAIDSLKIFAIFWIMLFHWLDFRNEWNLGRLFSKNELLQHFIKDGITLESIIKILISFGFLGVNIFFFISGFSLALSAKNKLQSYPIFLKKRVVRIFPPYWVVLISWLIMQIVRKEPLNYTNIIFHFLGIHTVHPNFIYSISTPLWFVGVILQFYLIFPLLFYGAQRIPTLIYLIILILIELYLNTYLRKNLGGLYFTNFIFEFGAAICFANTFASDDPKKHHRFYYLFIPVGILFVYLLSSPTRHISWPFVQLIKSALGAIWGIMFLVFLDNFKFKYISFFAVLSYPLYLTHYFVLTHIIDIHLPISMFTQFLYFISMAFIIALLLHYISLKITHFNYKLNINN